MTAPARPTPPCGICKGPTEPLTLPDGVVLPLLVPTICPKCDRVPGPLRPNR